MLYDNLWHRIAPWITGPVWGECPVHWCISITKGRITNAKLWCIFLFQDAICYIFQKASWCAYFLKRKFGCSDKFHRLLCWASIGTCVALATLQECSSSLNAGTLIEIKKFCYYKLTISEPITVRRLHEEISSTIIYIAVIKFITLVYLTHWGRVTHICVGNLNIIGPDNGFSPGRHQAIIWTNAGILLIGPWGTNFS